MYPLAAVTVGHPGKLGKLCPGSLPEYAAKLWPGCFRFFSESTLTLKLRFRVC